MKKCLFALPMLCILEYSDSMKPIKGVNKGDSKHTSVILQEESPKESRSFFSYFSCIRNSSRNNSAVLEKSKKISTKKSCNATLNSKKSNVGFSQTSDVLLLSGKQPSGVLQLSSTSTIMALEDSFTKATPKKNNYSAVKIVDGILKFESTALQGYHTFTLDNVTYNNCDFYNGKIFNGNAEFTLKNGNRMNASYDSCQICGKGMVTLANGGTISGMFKNGELQFGATDIITFSKDDISIKLKGIDPNTQPAMEKFSSLDVVNANYDKQLLSTHGTTKIIHGISPNSIPYNNMIIDEQYKIITFFDKAGADCAYGLMIYYNDSNALKRINNGWVLFSKDYNCYLANGAGLEYSFDALRKGNFVNNKKEGKYNGLFCRPVTYGDDKLVQ